MWRHSEQVYVYGNDKVLLCGGAESIMNALDKHMIS